MKFPWLAFLFLSVIAGCAEDSDPDSELAAEAHREGKRAPGPVMDAGLPGAVPCGKPESDAEPGGGGSLDASVGERCDVLLSLETDGGTGDVALTKSSGELILWLWAENRSEQAQTFRYAAPCHGLPLLGLGSYDPHMSCLAGRCQWPRAPIEVVLAPGERRELGLGYVDANPTACNRGGLAVGTYDVSYVLPELEGTRTCAQPLRLTVR